MANPKQRRATPHGPMVDEPPLSPQEQEDLEKARTTTRHGKEKTKWYQSIGPGLITGAADDDPSGIGTYSQSGASYGTAQLWLIPFSLPMMIAVQEMCGRVGLVTGEGIAAVIKQHYAKWLLYSTLGLLFFANILNIFADLNVMAASAKMLFGLPQLMWLTLITAAMIGLQILIPYKAYARVLKLLCLSLIGYAYVALAPGVSHNWPRIVHDLFVPSWSNKLDYLIAAVAFLGTTISPYLFYWQAGETVEEGIADGDADEPGSRKRKPRISQLRNIRADTVIGMVASQGVAFLIMIATAGTLFASGHHDINTAQDAALALKPLGAGAFWVFSIGMIGTGLLAIPTLAGSAAYAVSETFGWKYGLYRRFGQAKGFYLTVAGVMVLGYLLNFISKVSPIKALVYSAVVNGVIAVPLIVVLLLICNNKKIVGKHTNGPWSNLFGWLSVLFMGLASAFFIWAVVSGKAN